MAPKAPSEQQLRAMTPEQRMSVLVNARKLGGDLGRETEKLIDDLGLPLSSGALTVDDPLYLAMAELIWSREGRDAAEAAAEAGLPALAGVDPLLQREFGDRYNADVMATNNAGYILAELMRHSGYEEAGTAKCPAGCIAKSGIKWRRKTPLR